MNNNFNNNMPNNFINNNNMVNNGNMNMNNNNMSNFGQNNLNNLSNMSNDTNQYYEQECLNIFNDMVGNNIAYKSPIEGTLKHLIYCDFTASGKALKTIEYYIVKEIYPTYANVHSTVGLNAKKTGNYFEQSKEILREYTNAYDFYSVVFHGQGATGGVHKLIEMLSLKKYYSFYKTLKTAYSLKEKIGKNGNFYDICKTILQDIDRLFKELFVDISFCHVSKKRDGRHVVRCYLCNKELESEGDYGIHMNGENHKQMKENYYRSGNKIFYDFIETIREKYYNKDNYLLQLINDYQYFKPIVFYTRYEHNSNSLSWKEIGCDSIVIDPKDEDSLLKELEQYLNQYKDRYIKIGSFSACSNITGLLTDVDRLAYLVHSYNGYAIFDYAAGAPYLQMNVSGPLPDSYRKLLGFKELTIQEKNSNLIYKDGLFFSPHKFVGGPCTPGVLIVHDRVYRNQLKPTQPGGGTVHFVYKNSINYIKDVEYKEESGTPNIVGAIRLGIMLAARSKIPHDFLIQKDEKYNHLFVQELKDVENLYILHGNYLKNRPHIPIYSIMISYDGKFLHPNFVSAVLNDFFGVQTRPGCSCAPNYGRFLLGFDKNKNMVDYMRKIIDDGNGIFKPGYVRLNLTYFYPEYIIRYIIKCIKFVCQYAHCFLGLYNYDIKSGDFYLYNTKVSSLSINLLDITKIKYLEDNNLLYENRHMREITEANLESVYNIVKNYLESGNLLHETFTKGPYKVSQASFMNGNIQNYENVRWFLLFQDVKAFLEALYTNKLNGGNDMNIQQYYQADSVKRTIKMDSWNIISQMK